MRAVIRSAGVILLTIAAVVLLALTSTMTSVFTLAATTALILGGTGHPLSTPPDTVPFVQSYLAMAANNYIDPTPGNHVDPVNRVAVVTPEQFRFDTGPTDMSFDDSVAAGQSNLDNCIKGTACIYNRTAELGSTQPTTADEFTVFGYSQSATITTLEKRSLAAQYPAGTGPDVAFALIGNPNRPNGGILERFEGAYIPILGVTFSGATPTDTEYRTVDISRQYDGFSDFPTNPLNLLADLNAGMGIYYLHSDYASVGLGDAVLQGQYGDTTYYLVPTKTVPLLMPVQALPILGPLAAEALDPVVRVLVESGYDRSVSPGQPTKANFFYFPNPLRLAADLIVAVPTGLDNLLGDLTGSRPLGTREPGPYGVGGPDVTNDPTTNPTNTQTAAAVAAREASNAAAAGPASAPTAQPTVRSALSSPGVKMNTPAGARPLPEATIPTLPKIQHPSGMNSLRDLTLSITRPLKAPTATPGGTGASSPSQDSSSATAGRGARASAEPTAAGRRP